MGKASGDLGPLEVSFSDENSCTIRKKVVYLLAFLAIASCVVVGLLVYYVGVMGGPACSPAASTLSNDEVQIPTDGQPPASPPKKEKVSHTIIYDVHTIQVNFCLLTIFHA